MFKNANYDFLRWRWHALAVSLVIILAGLGVIATRGLQLGVEFAGGTSVILQFKQPTSEETVRDAVNAVFGEASVASYGPAGSNQILVRVPQVGQEQGGELTNAAGAVEDALRKANVGDFEVAGTQIVGPSVGEDLRRKGIWATVLALLGILLYLTFRYQFSFAIGAVVATVHDLLVTLSFLAFFQYDITLNVIAALLTVAGYSGNDTIVVFDRVRENLRGMRRDNLKEIINVAVNQTLSRTVITAGTTFLSVVALFLFGGDVLRGFAFTLMVGIISGTYSTVFIAAAIVTFWRGKGPMKAAARAPATASAGSGSSQQPTRKSKPQRKARAS
jgi:preprotein translocase subunit SecF